MYLQTLWSKALCVVMILAPALAVSQPDQSLQQAEAALQAARQRLADAQVLLHHAKKVLADPNSTAEDKRAAELIIAQANSLIGGGSSAPAPAGSQASPPLPGPTYKPDDQGLAPEMQSARTQLTKNQDSTKAAAGPSFTLLAALDHGKATPLVGVSGDVLKVAAWPNNSDINRAVLASGLDLKCYLDARSTLRADPSNPEKLRNFIGMYDQVKADIVPDAQLTLAGFVAGGVTPQTGQATSGFGLGPKLTLAHGDFTLMLGAYWPDLASGANGLRPQLMTGMTFTFLSSSK